MRIGIFDSGIGGLSVLYQARKMLPNAQYIYYADEKHVPYGEKKPEQVRKYISEIFEFMMEKEVDAVVIACNTATAAATKEFRDSFPVPVVGMEPAVKKAVDMYEQENKKILVAATPVTIAGEKLHNLVERVDVSNEVELMAMPMLVRYAESGVFDSVEVDEYIRQCLQNYSIEEIGTVVLGCTHFNYFKDNFRRVCGENVHLVDGNEGTIRQLMTYFKNVDNVDEEGSIEYYYSGEVVTDVQMRSIIMCMDRLEQEAKQ